MSTLSLSSFKQEVRVSYCRETFLVRDNGSVCRLPRESLPIRQLDGVWTFGTQCPNSGYMRISALIVHRIVATAFLGDQPSIEHVVDHIDTNRSNNRIENLRWVTRLENILGNQKTLHRVVQKWGSVEGMLNDPDRAEKADPLTNRSWMRRRAVEVSRGSSSLTSLAIQRDWKTPSEFPLCPAELSDQPLRDYLERLREGSVFMRNRYGSSQVERAALNWDGLCLGVITRLPKGAVKPWALAKITFEDGKFVHASGGTFFSYEGAEKCYCGLVGIQWEGGDTFDDFC